MVNSRLGGCHLCTKYIGKVFIDDVYSGGKKSDGDYPLLSEAIKGGLFHPNCKDGLSTYFEDITTLNPVTDEEAEVLDSRRKLEAQKNYYDNQAQKCDRISKHSLDKENKHIYKIRAQTNKEKADEIGGKITESLAKSNGSGIIKVSMDKQFGKKVGKHAVDFGLDPSSKDDREQFLKIVSDILNKPDRITTGEWRGQEEDVWFYIKDEDVVVTKKNNDFITILKGGVNNARVKNSRNKKV